MAQPTGSGAGLANSPGTLSWILTALIAGAVSTPTAYLVIRAAGADAGVWTLILRPETTRLLANTLTLVLAVTAASTILAVPLAWLTVRTDLPLRRFWSVALAVPLAVPSYLGAYAVVAALGPRGMLQQVLGRVLGLERFPDLYGLPGAALTLTLYSYPYVYLNVRAALLRQDPAVEEASRTLGVGPWATFWRAVLPGLRPAIGSGALLTALYVISDFGAVSFLQFDTFTRAVYVQYQAAFDRTYGAVLGLVLVALTWLVVAAERRARGRAAHAQARSEPGPGRRLSPVRLGRWRWPAFLLCTLVLALALGTPLAAVLFWLDRGLAAREAWWPVWAAAARSVWISLLAALVAMALALPVARVTASSHSAWARRWEDLIYLGHALPGMVVALGLVFFGIHVARPLYQTLTLLVFAYVVMFLPRAVGPLRVAFLQLNPHVLEAARTLGATPLRATRSVTLPLVEPGLLGGGAMVFLTVMKELPATLLLSPVEFRTLATMVWSATSEGFYARAAPAALLLILASFASVFFLFGEERWSAAGSPVLRRERP